MAALPSYLPVPPSGWPLCHCFIACWNADIRGHGPTSAELNATTATRSRSPTRFKMSQPFLTPTEMIFPCFISLSVRFPCLFSPSLISVCAGKAPLDRFPTWAVSSSSRGAGQHSTPQQFLAAPQAAHRGLDPT